MSDSVIQLAGSSRSVFVAWQSLQRSARGANANNKRQKRGTGGEASSGQTGG